MPSSRLLHACVDVVRQSGRIIHEQWARPSHVRHKGSIDLVTETDLAVEAFLKEKLAPLVPQAAFMAEESCRSLSTPPALCWIIDPVDGTTNFVHRIPMVGTSVALWQDGQVVLGVVNVPMLETCYWAQRGEGAFCNGTPLAVSAVTEMQDALVATGFPYDVPAHLSDIMHCMGTVLPAAQGMRRLGAASVDLAYVASGHMDAYYEGALKPWDVAAGWLLVEEAGGRVSRRDGGAFGFGEMIVASNGHVHEALLSLIAAP